MTRGVGEQGGRCSSRLGDSSEQTREGEGWGRTTGKVEE
jgi:hypothetical protein